MKKINHAIISFLTCMLMLVSVVYAGPKIILKLDDFKAPTNTNNCKDVMDFLIQRQVKAGFGAIANSFDNTSLATMTPYLNAKNASGQKLFEIWHHGYDHLSYAGNGEFSNQTYTYQKTHFDQASQLIKQYLGVQMHTLGTPGNASDTITNRVISEDPNYKVFIFATVKPAVSNGVTYMDNRVNIETSTGNPDSAYLATNYFANRNTFTDFMILQAHPPLFTAAGLLQFKKSIDFLIKQGCVFMTPYEYYQYVNFAPANLKISVVSDTRIDLTWQDKATNETAYTVERSANGKDWVTIATLATNSSTYTDQAATNAKSAPLYYRVCAKTSTDNFYSDIMRNNVGFKYYVDPLSGNDANTGLSWSQAVKTIDKATSIAATTMGTDDIYIKGGTTINFSTFTWDTTPENFYGGFQGTESNPDERPLVDADKNGIIEPWEFKYPTTILSASVNAAVQISSPVFNGFTITHTAAKTGVLTTVTCNPNGLFTNNTLSNCTLEVTESGGITLGGILIRASGVVKNCLFEKNQVNVIIAQTTDKPFAPLMDVALGTKVSGCVFRNNNVKVDCTGSAAGTVAYARGMIINTFGGAAGVPSSISNCLIYNNEANYYGGGGTSTATMPYAATIASSGYSTGASTDSVMNCTVANNKTTSMVCAGLSLQSSGTLVHYAYNNVFWNNLNFDTSGTSTLKNLSIASSVTTGCVGYNVSNGGQSGGFTGNAITPGNSFDLSSSNSGGPKNPLFKQPTIVVGASTNGTVETANWKLNAGSCLISKGYTTTNLFDLAGTAFTAVRSVGAYEYVSSTGVYGAVADSPTCIKVVRNGIIASFDGVLEIFSIHGQLLQHKNVSLGQYEHCPAGLYVCRCTTAVGVAFQKIIVQ